MASATKFIDFFVHDILDYSILNKEDNNFAKNITLFNIHSAVNEIIVCFEDKVKLKKIVIETHFEGFDQEGELHIVKTDQKRMQ